MYIYTLKKQSMWKDILGFIPLQNAFMFKQAYCKQFLNLHFMFLQDHQPQTFQTFCFCPLSTFSGQCLTQTSKYIILDFRHSFRLATSWSIIIIIQRKSKWDTIIQLLAWFLEKCMNGKQWLEVYTRQVTV